MGVIWSRLLLPWWWAEAPAQVVTPEKAYPLDPNAQASGKEPASVPCTMELRTMVQTDTPSQDTPSVLVDGKHWTLSPPLDIDSPALPPYVCVSYVWGLERTPNPIYPSIEMSSRTLATFTAAARCVPGHPIWIDAFSVPVQREKKRATLESLGCIFARGHAVVAVLAPESLAAVAQMEQFLALDPRPEAVPTAPLDVLNADEWIRSVWTYQELVNSQTLWFVCHAHEGSPSPPPVRGQDLFQIVGGYLDRWGKSHGGKLPGVRLTYPHADNFQELLADWMISDYGHRSALQIICGMEYRAGVTPQNRFYSMIGALTAQPSTRATSPTVEQLAERFMELCEEKGDYSFIFSSAARDARPGLRWRPTPCDLESVLTWHIFGEDQPGTKVDNGVLLTNVLVYPLPTSSRDKVQMGHDLRDHFLGWIRVEKEYHNLATDDTNTTLEELGHRILQSMRFAGTGGWHVAEDVVFYPLHKLPESDESEVTLCVSHGVRWIFGAPAIAAIKKEGRTEYMPGVAITHMDFATPTTEFLLS
ncbi:hypothetical protein C2E23DRAFT_889203 [Lenzites betulinus]|nr:hypothetical protein C2E23DRAFT_889203 [Lenzites betulinus]